MKKVLKVMDSSGDSSKEFDSSVDNEAKSEARVFFDNLMAKGSVVFAVNIPEGDKPVKKFDDLAAENIVVPRISGG